MKLKRKALTVPCSSSAQCSSSVSMSAVMGLTGAVQVMVSDWGGEQGIMSCMMNMNGSRQYLRQRGRGFLRLGNIPHVVSIFYSNVDHRPSLHPLHQLEGSSTL